MIRFVLFGMLLGLFSGSVSSALAQRVIPQRGHVTVTFDDSLVSAYTYALPILKELKLVCTQFLHTVDVAAVSGAEAGWEPMTWAQVRAWKAAGCEIGAHTHNHFDLTTLSLPEIIFELTESTVLIAKQAGPDYPISFASPYGRINDVALAQVQRFYRSYSGAQEYTLGADALQSFDSASIPWDLKRWVILRDTTALHVCSTINLAATQKKWLILAFHNVKPQSEDAYDVSEANFRAIMTCIKNGVTIGTIKNTTIRGTLLAMRVIPPWSK